MVYCTSPSVPVLYASEKRYVNSLKSFLSVNEEYKGEVASVFSSSIQGLAANPSASRRKRVFDSELEIHLKEICHSLNNTTTPFEILNWLENFEEHEIPIALTVLKNLKYFKVEDIIKEFDYHLDKYLNHYSR